jgi:hypothetical protein
VHLNITRMLTIQSHQAYEENCKQKICSDNLSINFSAISPATKLSAQKKSKRNKNIVNLTHYQTMM